MKKTLYFQQAGTVDGKNVNPGDVAATYDGVLPIERLPASLANGRVAEGKPDVKPEPKAETPDDKPKK